MTLKGIIKLIFLLTCIITTVHILVISIVNIYFYIAMNTRLLTPIYRLYRYPLASFLSALPSLIFVNSDQTTKNGWKIRLIVHFFLTITMTVLGIIIGWHGWYGWRYLFSSILAGYFNIIFIVFLTVYISAICLFRRQQKELSEKLNEQIKSFQQPIE